MEETVIAKLGHRYGAATYTWSADHSTCTAKKVCKNDPTHYFTETVQTTSAVKTPATSTSKGVTTYTAVFTKTGFKTQTKDVANIAMLSDP